MIKGNIPLPEIALGFGSDGTPEAVHVGAESVDLGDVPLDREGELRRVRDASGDGRRGGGEGGIEALEAAEGISGAEEKAAGALVDVRNRAPTAPASTAASFHWWLLSEDGVWRKRRIDGELG